MTRSIFFFYQKLRKGCPIIYAKFQHDPTHSSACIKKKKISDGSHRPPTPARTRVKNNIHMYHTTVRTRCFLSLHLIFHHILSTSCFIVVDYWGFRACRLQMSFGAHHSSLNAVPMLVLSHLLKRKTGQINNTLVPCISFAKRVTDNCFCNCGSVRQAISCTSFYTTETHNTQCAHILFLYFVRTFWMEGFTRTEPPLSRGCCVGPVPYPSIAQCLFYGRFRVECLTSSLNG